MSADNHPVAGIQGARAVHAGQLVVHPPLYRTPQGPRAPNSGSKPSSAISPTAPLRDRDGEEGERVEVRQGSVPDPDLVVTGDAETFLAVASGRLSPEEAVQSGALRVEGDREEDREALLAWCQSLVGPAAA